MQAIMSAVDDLLSAIFEHRHPTFYADFEGWLRNSRRFRDFVHNYRNKIHAKLKNAKHGRALDDLRAELQTAALLLNEERFTLEYERYAATKQRGPDFTVTYKGHTAFNVEVRRLPSDPGRLPSIICEKIGQFPPSIINLLWLAGQNPTTADLNRAMATLRQAAENKDETYIRRHGFSSAADFAKRYPRLSGCILVHKQSHTTMWLNPQARHTIPSDLAKLLRKLQ